MGSYLHRVLHIPYTYLHHPYTENVKGLTGLTVMPKKEWEYYSLHWIECSQQWQITQDKTNNNGNACYWDYIDDACEDLGRMGWKPILLSDKVILFRRKKKDA